MNCQAKDCHQIAILNGLKICGRAFEQSQRLESVSNLDWCRWPRKNKLNQEEIVAKDCKRRNKETRRGLTKNERRKVRKREKK